MLATVASSVCNSPFDWNPQSSVQSLDSLLATSDGSVHSSPSDGNPGPGFPFSGVCWFSTFPTAQLHSENCWWCTQSLSMVSNVTVTADALRCTQGKGCCGRDSQKPKATKLMGTGQALQNLLGCLPANSKTPVLG